MGRVWSVTFKDGVRVKIHSSVLATKVLRCLLDIQVVRQVGSCLNVSGVQGWKYKCGFLYKFEPASVTVKIKSFKNLDGS